MAENLVKPEPEDEEPPAPVMELVPPGPTPRLPWLQALWARLQEDAQTDGEGRQRALAVPTLRQYRLGRSDLRTVWTGALIIFRSSWALARRAWMLILAAARKAAIKTPPPEAKDEDKSKGKDKEKGGDKADERASETAEEKPKAAKQKPKSKARKTSERGKEEQSKGLTFDVALSGLLLGAMGVMFVTYNVIRPLTGAAVGLGTYIANHPVPTARGAGLALLIFVLASWVVGHAAGGAEPRARSAEDHESGQGSGEAEADHGSGEEASQSPEEAAERARIRVYGWVRGSITSLGNGRNVHLRELLLDAQKEPGGEHLTMPQLRASLTAHGIPIRTGVKAPASDHDGATRNRPGISLADLPQSFTPLPTQGDNLVRLLPTYQATDQQ